LLDIGETDGLNPYRKLNTNALTKSEVDILVIEERIPSQVSLFLFIFFILIRIFIIKRRENILHVRHSANHRMHVSILSTLQRRSFNLELRNSGTNNI